MKKYVGIWLDHRKAYIVTLTKDNLPPEKDRAIIEQVKSGMERKVRLSGGSRSGKTPYGPQDVSVDGKMESRIKHQLKYYYQSIIQKIEDSNRIIIFGPGEAKIEFKKEIEKFGDLASKIKSVEPADKMTEKQIIARVKDYFVSYS